ncbi:MAG: sigma-54-dependent Fis family transcriptional regulator [Polyangiaceae bacterium]|nr:sigma-54-dependent Fis family transcriptional regulator [Polyangiaceae bacterium]
MSLLGSTVDGDGSNSSVHSAAREPLLLALMIAWAPHEPERVGEVALFDKDGGSRIFGRGGSDVDDGKRVVFFRQRPGSLERAAPISSPGLSREQLRLRVDRNRLCLDRIGKCALKVNGQYLDQCSIGPGDLVLLKGQMLFYCTMRPRNMARLQSAEPSATHGFGEADAHGIVGESAVAWQLRDKLAWAGKIEEHTLFLGGSGSGKELCARAVHALSKRANGPFVARNAATIPAGIIDAELFGNVKNYPNPGMPERPGLIGSAHGGTLFLDEVGELSATLQANLLRVLDAGGEYHNLGGATTKHSHFRLLGATNRHPSELKHDFAARLILRIPVPGLDDRREDIPLLIRHSLHRARAKSPEAVARFFEAKSGQRSEPNLKSNVIEALMKHSFATNVRELDALLWQAMASSTGDVIEWSDALREQRLNPPTDERDVVSDNEEEMVAESKVRAALAHCGGNVAQAAQALGLPTRYVLYRLMKKYGIRTG